MLTFFLAHALRTILSKGCSTAPPHHHRTCTLPCSQTHLEHKLLMQSLSALQRPAGIEVTPKILFLTEEIKRKYLHERNCVFILSTAHLWKVKVQEKCCL